MGRPEKTFRFIPLETTRGFVSCAIHGYFALERNSSLLLRLALSLHYNVLTYLPTSYLHLFHSWLHFRRVYPFGSVINVRRVTRPSCQRPNLTVSFLPGPLLWSGRKYFPYEGQVGGRRGGCFPCLTRVLGLTSRRSKTFSEGAVQGPPNYSSCLSVNERRGF